MKKIILFVVSFFPLWGLGGLSFAQSSVVVTPITANYTASTPTVTFKVSWEAGSRSENYRSKVWVFVDYRRIKNNAPAGGWLRAGIAALPTTTQGTTTAGNASGFWLQGTDGAFAATVTVPVTVDLNGYAKQFGWCGVATDRPPTAEEKSAYYVLQGTPPFIIQTDPNNTSSTVPEPSHSYTGCIYNLTDATGCPGELPAMPSVNSFTASTTSICYGQSATLTANATNAQLYSFDDGATWGNSASTVVTPLTTTTYKLKVTRTAGGCTYTHPTTNTVTVRPLPEPAFVNPPTGLCADSEATLTVNDPTGAASSYCFRYECADCVHNPYLTGNDAPAEAACYWFPECIYTEANTYTVTMYDGGNITVWAKAKTEFGCVNSVSIAISKNAPPTITWLSGDPEQTVATDVAITDIKYTTTNASGATATGLPDGISESWVADVYTISGTPTATGTFIYTVATTNSNGCTNDSASGTLTVTASCTACANWSTCSGFTMVSNVSYEANARMKWADAVTYCQNKGSGWRLPDITELKCMCSEKADLPGGWLDRSYWSNSRVQEGYAQSVDFGDCWSAQNTLSYLTEFKCVW